MTDSCVWLLVKALKHKDGADMMVSKMTVPATQINALFNRLIRSYVSQLNGELIINVLIMSGRMYLSVGAPLALCVLKGEEQV